MGLLGILDSKGRERSGIHSPVIDKKCPVEQCFVLKEKTLIDCVCMCMKHRLHA
uniref:Uncharacterized protein n=1 Tax=Rhizophora mucronata TaxID=61149 RepID=A0A2P2PUH4_RHIMU